MAVAKEDTDLIEEALAGNTDAFGLLVCKYQDRLFNAVYYVVRCRETAEDVVQDAFVRAFLKLSSFQQSSAFYTWLYRIAFNAAISERRRRKPQSSVEQQREASGIEPADHAEGPEQHLERQERVERVHEALDSLGDQHRAILVLRDLEGLSYEEIGAVLDLAPGTVRSRLHRARIQLKDQLKESMQER